MVDINDPQARLEALKRMRDHYIQIRLDMMQAGVLLQGIEMLLQQTAVSQDDLYGTELRDVARILGEAIGAEPYP